MSKKKPPGKVIQLGHGPGRTSGTWKKGEPRPPGIRSGRKKGSKNKIPRSLKQSIDQICQEMVEFDQDRIRRAFRRGLDARPPASYAYLQLIAAYTVGRPTERIQIEGQVQIQVSQAGQAFKSKMEQVAENLARARERDRIEAERLALPWATETVLDAAAIPEGGP